MSTSMNFEAYFFALDTFSLSLVRSLRRKGLVYDSVCVEYINEFIMNKWTYDREKAMDNP